MKYYPAYLDLRERRCLVVGGGRVAERKTLSLLEAGANVALVSPDLTPKLQLLSASGKIVHIPRTFRETDLADAYLVIAATNRPGVNTDIGVSCRKKKILVNVVAPPGESTFVVPSVVERGSLLIAVSTSGESPALAKRIRTKLEKDFGPEYGIFLDKMALLRGRLRELVPDESERNRILNAVAESEVLDLLAKGKKEQADAVIARISGLK